MAIEFVFALAIKAKIKPKDLAQVVASGDVDRYLIEFTKEFAEASVKRMAKKLKSIKK